MKTETGFEGADYETLLFAIHLAQKEIARIKADRKDAEERYEALVEQARAVVEQYEEDMGRLPVPMDNMRALLEGKHD